MKRGIYWISTGHYVRKVLSGGKYYIAPAADRDKDQTFLPVGLEAGYHTAYVASDGRYYEK